MNLEHVLISIFEVPAGTFQIDKLHHASSRKIEQRKYFEQVGLTFSDSLCALIGTSQDIAESELGKLVQKIKYHIQTECFESIYQHVAPYVEFGPGVTDDEKSAEGVKLSICNYLVGYLCYMGYFSNCVRYFSRDIIGAEFDLTADYKTLLQEYCHRHKIQSPRYEIESVEGEQHDLEFSCTCEVSGLGQFKGRGASKKSAQKKAAENVVTSLRIIKRNLVKISPIDYLYFNKDVRGHVSMKKIHEKFSIPFEINILAAYIPSRYRLDNYWKSKSNRPLAMLGSYILSYFMSMEILFRALDNTLNGADRTVIGTELLKNSNLSKAYDCEVISTRYLPFKGHGDFENDNYKVDCIQALFAIKFLLSMVKNRPNEIWDCDFSKWLKKRIDFITKQFKGKELDKISITSNRYHTIGFIYENINIILNNVFFYAVKITHAKSGAEYIFKSTSLYELKKEAYLDLAGRALSVIDSLSGLVLPRNFIKYNDEQLSLASFICEQLISCTINDKILKKIIDKEVNSHSDLIEIPELGPHEILSFVKDNELSIVTKAKYISRFHMKLGLSGEIVSSKNVVYYPFVFTSYISNIADSELIDYSNKNILVKEEDLFSEFNILHDNQLKPEINRFLSERIINTSKTTVINRDHIEGYKKLVEKMSINELEKLWVERRNVFEYREEASIVLSFLRYQKGIDFAQKSYLNFLDCDLIIELGLPRLCFPAAISKPTYVKSENNIKTNQSNLLQKKIITKKNYNFEVSHDDEREFVEKSVANRKGQQGFRQDQIKRWGSCCISGCSVKDVLEAAHIAPYRGEKDNHPLNGLLLRSDIHKLFDKFLIAIEPGSLQIKISPDLMESEYSAYNGVQLGLENCAEISIQAIEYHWHYFKESHGLAFPEVKAVRYV